jgi:hypothetical protein
MSHFAFVALRPGRVRLRVYEEQEAALRAAKFLVMRSYAIKWLTSPSPRTEPPPEIAFASPTSP